MNRRTVFLMGLAGAAGCSRDTRRRLNMLNWSTYVAPDTVPAFEREFGVRVRYSVYESNEEMLAKVMSGNSGWDVVFPTSYYVQPMREQGLLARLDHSRLPGLEHLDEKFQRPVWDPGLEWSMPYMWNATGIIFNPGAGREAARWSDLWEPVWSGRLTMLDDPVDVLGVSLKKLGFSFNSFDPSHLRLAQREALRQKPMVRAYLNAEVRDQLVSGDVLAAQLWSTTAQQAIDANPQLRFSYPAEGFPLYMDTAVILRESARPELAHDFLNFLLRPKVAAGIVAAVRTATANSSARALLAEPLRTNPTLYPPPEVFARGEWVASSSPDLQRLRDRLWTEIKAA